MIMYKSRDVRVTAYFFTTGCLLDVTLLGTAAVVGGIALPLGKPLIIITNLH